MMERLTKHKYGVVYAEGDHISVSVGRKSAPSTVRGDIVDRLAAYEDTGLEPEEIKSRDEIDLNAAICIAEYAKDKKPIETARDDHDKAYRMGWEDACQYIRKEFEGLSQNK